jgi:hypothetical protein
MNLYIEREVAHLDVSHDGSKQRRRIMQSISLKAAKLLDTANYGAVAENTIQGGQRSRRIDGVRSRTRRSAIYSRKFIGADRNFICSNVVSAGGNGGDISTLARWV